MLLVQPEVALPTWSVEELPGRIAESFGVNDNGAVGVGITQFAYMINDGFDVERVALDGGAHDPAVISMDDGDDGTGSTAQHDGVRGPTHAASSPLHGCGNPGRPVVRGRADACRVQEPDDRVAFIDRLSRREAKGATAVTTNTATIQQVTGVKPTRNRFMLVAGLVGAVAAIFTVFLALLFTVPGSLSAIIGLVVGTFVAGRMVGAKTGKRWAISFGLVLFYFVVVDVAIIFVLLAAGPSVLPAG